MLNFKNYLSFAICKILKSVSFFVKKKKCFFKIRVSYLNLIYLAVMFYFIKIR
jgi:hypothetical protein